MVVSFYFFWLVFRPSGGLIGLGGIWEIGGFHFDDLAKVIGCSLMCGGAVWIIYYFAKFVVEGFVSSEDVEIEKSNSL